MSDTKPARAIVAAAFEAAVDHRTHRAYRCRNGQPYGIGVLARLQPTQRYRSYAATYPMQDAGDPEQRVWLCLQAAVYACTTHLASRSAIVALAQCDYLLQVAMPSVRRRGGQEPVVLGADLNLTSGGLPDARSCLTGRYRRADDGATQYVVATRVFMVRSSSAISMQGTTDHPGLLVDLTLG